MFVSRADHLGVLCRGHCGGRYMDTRAWYVERLQRVFDSMQVTKWTEVVELIERTFLPDMRLPERFKFVWQEIGYVRQGRN